MPDLESLVGFARQAVDNKYKYLSRFFSLESDMRKNVYKYLSDFRLRYNYDMHLKSLQSLKQELGDKYKLDLKKHSRLLEDYKNYLDSKEFIKRNYNNLRYHEKLKLEYEELIAEKAGLKLAKSYLPEKAYYEYARSLGIRAVSLLLDIGEAKFFRDKTPRNLMLKTLKEIAALGIREPLIMGEVIKHFIIT